MMKGDWIILCPLKKNCFLDVLKSTVTLIKNQHDINLLKICSDNIYNHPHHWSKALERWESASQFMSKEILHACSQILSILNCLEKDKSARHFYAALSINLNTLMLIEGFMAGGCNKNITFSSIKTLQAQSLSFIRLWFCLVKVLTCFPASLIISPCESGILNYFCGRRAGFSPPSDVVRPTLPRCPVLMRVCFEVCMERE